MSKSLIAVLLASGLAAFAQPAHAFIAEVATSISATTLADDTQLEQALQKAFRDVLERAIAFTPSMVELRDVKRVGDRVYLLFLVADAEGEETLKAFVDSQTSPAD